MIPLLSDLSRIRTVPQTIDPANVEEILKQKALSEAELSGIEEGSEGQFQDDNDNGESEGEDRDPSETISNINNADMSEITSSTSKEIKEAIRPMKTNRQIREEESQYKGWMAATLGRQIKSF